MVKEIDRQLFLHMARNKIYIYIKKQADVTESLGKKTKQNKLEQIQVNNETSRHLVCVRLCEHKYDHDVIVVPQQKKKNLSDSEI